MTTTGETPKVTLGDRFARAWAIFLDRRVLGHRPQQEFPFG